MLATTLIQLFLRIISLWVGFLSIQRGVLTFLIQDMHVMSAQWTIVLCVLFFSMALLIWFFSGGLSSFIVAKKDHGTTLGWSSHEVVLSAVAMIGLYSLFIDAMPAVFEFSARILIMLSSGQYAYLTDASILVPGAITLLKVAFAVLIIIKSNVISQRITSATAERLAN